ncbi:MAG: c-type cytochrome [Verrucomicrobiales bacterium]|nr:c-type cytochrome [Verrucomicrobiales bacterium]
MIRLPIFAALNFSAFACLASENFQKPEMTVPEGLEVVVAAAPPLVEHPIMAAFDDRGRLFVSENAGLNLKQTELDEQKPNSIRVLIDTDNDGIFDDWKLFADGLTFPQGALWLMDSLYVMSPPGLWRFTDHDDDGVADEREQLVTGFAYTGNAADVHGPFLHPNGRLYWCHGRKGHDVTDESTGEVVSQNKGARIWSCLPDGSDVRVFAGGGMDNPVEVDFTEAGEIIGTVNLFYGRPRGDTLVHWIRGGAYPRYDQEAVVAEFARTGPLLTEFYNFGHVAVSGMMRYRTGALNPAWKDNLFVTHFNTQEVTRTEFSSEESTFAAGKTESILKIHNPDVHITDVLEDANGDVLVLDTGGWFRIGCPTSQVAKPEIPGAIYRIRKAGDRDTETDFRGTGVDWKNLEPNEIAQLLDDEFFPIRERAMTELAIIGEPAVPELRDVIGNPQSTPMALRNAVFTLARMRFSDAPDLIRVCLEHSDPTVQQAACNALATTRAWHVITNHTSEETEIELWRNEMLGERLIELAADAEPAVSRAAASALGAMREENAVPTLLLLAGQSNIDRFREHAAIYSLIEIGDAALTRTGLPNENPRIVAAALWALDQMADSDLEVLEVAPFLASEHEELRKVAVEISAGHADWDAAVANRFLEFSESPNEAKTATLIELGSKFAGTPPMQGLIATLLSSDKLQLRQTGFRTIAATTGPVPFAAEWETPFSAALEAKDDSLVDLALEALAKTKTDAFNEQLKEIAADGTVPPLKRVRALRAISGENVPLGKEAFDLLAGLVTAEASPLRRLEAVQMLGSARLTPPQIQALAERVQHAGPMDLPVLMKAFQRTRDEKIGHALADNLPKSTGFGNLNPSDLRRLFLKFPPGVLPKIEDNIAELEARAVERKERLALFESRVAEGDVERGKAHFVAGKGACMTCHKVGETGRAVGPDLSTIGRIRTHRDLLESILYPSESIARDFESYTVTPKEGPPLLGLIQRETADTVFVTDVTGTERLIARDEVESIEPIAVSIMPQGLEQALTEAELLDLVAYLKSLQ